MVHIILFPQKKLPLFLIEYEKLWDYLTFFPEKKKRT
jgi:hypothetical protein